MLFETARLTRGGTEIQAGEATLLIGNTTVYDFICSDEHLPAKAHLTIYRPIAADRYYITGDYAQGNYDWPGNSSLVVGVHNDDPEAPLLAMPLGYRMVWSSRGTEGEHQFSIWRPVAPQGYIALGCVAAEGFEPPVIHNYRCVRADLTMPSGAGGPIWTNLGSGSEKDVILYHVHGDDGLFVAQDNYAPFRGTAFRLINDQSFWL